jgi:hypothetical protein
VVTAGADCVVGGVNWTAGCGGVCRDPIQSIPRNATKISIAQAVFPMICPIPLQISVQAL